MGIYASYAVLRDVAALQAAAGKGVEGGLEGQMVVARRTVCTIVECTATKFSSLLLRHI